MIHCRYKNWYSPKQIIRKDTKKWEDSEEDGNITVHQLEEEGNHVAGYSVCCPSWIFSVSKSKILGQCI
jgi:hypothetical protein